MSEPGTEGIPVKAESGAKSRGFFDSLSSFKGSTPPEASSAKGAPTRESLKTSQRIKPIVFEDDPRSRAAAYKKPKSQADLEVDRKDFENLIKELLVATTESWSDDRYEILATVHPEKIARALADKAKLTDLEKKHFGRLSVRLWEKYIGGEFEYSDEAMITALGISYYLRNREPSRMARAVTHGKADQQPPLQRAADINPGNNGHGQVDRGVAPRVVDPR